MARVGQGRLGLRRKNYRETGGQNLADLKHRREPQRNFLTWRGNMSKWLITIQVLRLPGGISSPWIKSSFPRMKGHCHFLVTLPLGVTNESIKRYRQRKKFSGYKAEFFPIRLGDNIPPSARHALGGLHGHGWCHIQREYASSLLYYFGIQFSTGKTHPDKQLLTASVPWCSTPYWPGPALFTCEHMTGDTHCCISIPLVLIGSKRTKTLFCLTWKHSI